LKFTKKYIALAILVLLISLGLFVQLDYYIVMPSRAVNLAEIISIDSADQDDEGSFYLVTVSQKRASPITAAYGLFHPHMDINPIDSVIPTGMDESEYRQLLNENMVESRHLAQVVALRRAGYDVEINSEGVEIIGLTDNAPAQGFLFKGDIIRAVDGVPVFLATEIPLLVQDRAVGDEVTLEIERDNLQASVTVKTAESPEDSELPILGIFIKTLPWEPVLPLEIAMNTGRIGGPSAGLMFVLEILNQLQPGDLTAGRDIAGTGTIDINENVGRIGGVVQKVVAAEKAGAEYFLVPRSNYEQAQKVARKIELVPVEKLEEVLQFLSGLD
jgi:Lon-like protease